MVRRAHAEGARGFGEHKVRLPVDDPRSLALYRLCGDLGLPVLLHFEYGVYNWNFEAFEIVLREFPRTTFVGHAQAFWANVSADAPRDPDAPGYTAYPKGPVQPGGLTDRWLGEYPNLYADLSAGSGLGALSRDPEWTRGFLHRHQGRLLWATDCPCRDGRGDWGPQAGQRECFAARSLPLLRELSPTPAGLRGHHRRQRPAPAEPVAACRRCRPRAVQRCGRPRRAPSTAPKTAWRHTCCAAVRGR